MEITVKKMGEGLAVPLPQDIVAALAMKEGTAVSLTVEGSSLVLKPARKLRLSEMLVNHRPEHNHSETDWGATKGKEAW